MKISDVISDIQQKITENLCGEFFYYNGRSKCPSAKGKYTYKLILKERIIVFIDLYQKKAFHLIWKGKTND